MFQATHDVNQKFVNNFYAAVAAGIDSTGVKLVYNKQWGSLVRKVVSVTTGKTLGMIRQARSSAYSGYSEKFTLEATRIPRAGHWRGTRTLSKVKSMVSAIDLFCRDTTEDEVALVAALEAKKKRPTVECRTFLTGLYA